MKRTHWQSLIVAAGWLMAASVHAQTPLYPTPSPIASRQVTPRPESDLVPATGVLSDWIAYRRDCCEGPPGRYTPLYTELYVRAGPSEPVGGGVLNRDLQTGWSFQGGARALFFDEPHTAAWVVDLHIINTYESAGANKTQFAVTAPVKGVTVNYGQGGIPGATLQGSNRTLVGVGFGREWYLREPATSDAWRWRWGLDAGGRYGSHRININEGGHLVDVIGGTYAAVHTDVEIPCKQFVFYTGLRLEWAYTWSDILQQPSDVQDLTLYLTLGVRY